MGFPRQEYWNGLPFHSPGYLPNLRNERTSPALASGFFTTKPPGKPLYLCVCVCVCVERKRGREGKGKKDRVGVSHVKSSRYTFFSRPHGTFFRLYHMLSHTMNLHKFFLKIEIISNIFSDYNIMRLELNYKKKLKK